MNRPFYGVIRSTESAVQVLKQNKRTEDREAGGPPAQHTLTSAAFTIPGWPRSNTGAGTLTMVSSP